MNTGIFSESRLYVFILFLVSLVFISTVFFFSFNQGGNENLEVLIGNGSENFTVYLEKAENPQERSRGLMNRKNLPEEEGMIFIYDEESSRSFWMKNTRIPLDIIFVSESGIINDIDRADPEPGVADEDLERYRGEAMYVLELNQNFTSSRNISENNRIFLDF